MNITQVKAQHPTFLTDMILVQKHGRNNFYIDPRTEMVLNNEIPKVKPFAWNHTYLWIVCPYCQKIHEYPIYLVRKNQYTVYGNCKGRINNGIDQAAIQIDCSEMKVR